MTRDRFIVECSMRLLAASFPVGEGDEVLKVLVEECVHAAKLLMNELESDSDITPWS